MKNRLTGNVRVIALSCLFLFAGGVTTGNDAIENELPVWSLSAAGSAQLGKRFDGGWYSIRPPRGFVNLRPDNQKADAKAENGGREEANAGVKIGLWAIGTDHSVNPTITVMSFPPAKGDRREEKLFEGIVGTLTHNWNQVKGSKILRGNWNQRTAYRFHFSARTDRDEAVHGIVMSEISKKGTFIVSVVGPSKYPDDEQRLKLLAHAAVSCRKK